MVYALIVSLHFQLLSSRIDAELSLLLACSMKSDSFFNVDAVVSSALSKALGFVEGFLLSEVLESRIDSRSFPA